MMGAKGMRAGRIKKSAADYPVGQPKPHGHTITKNLSPCKEIQDSTMLLTCGGQPESSTQA